MTTAAKSLRSANVMPLGGKGYICSRARLESIRSCNRSARIQEGQHERGQAKEALLVDGLRWMHPRDCHRSTCWKVKYRSLGKG